MVSAGRLQPYWQPGLPQHSIGPGERCHRPAYWWLGCTSVGNCQVTGSQCGCGVLLIGSPGIALCSLLVYDRQSSHEYGDDQDTGQDEGAAAQPGGRLCRSSACSLSASATFWAASSSSTGARGSAAASTSCSRARTSRQAAKNSRSTWLNSSDAWKPIFQLSDNGSSRRYRVSERFSRSHRAAWRCSRLRLAWNQTALLGVPAGSAGRGPARTRWCPAASRPAPGGRLPAGGWPGCPARCCPPAAISTWPRMPASVNQLVLEPLPDGPLFHLGWPSPRRHPARRNIRPGIGPRSQWPMMSSSVILPLSAASFCHRRKQTTWSCTGSTYGPSCFHAAVRDLHLHLAGNR